MTRVRLDDQGARADDRELGARRRGGPEASERAGGGRGVDRQTTTADLEADATGEGDLDLSRLLLGREPLPEVLGRVARLARATIPGIDEASVTLVDGDRARTVVFTSDLAVQLDERQYADGFGPCIDAARAGRLIQVPDTDADPAYPGFAVQAARAGVTRTLSVGLPVPDRSVGGLNLYSRSGRGFDAATLAAAHAFADDAAVGVANASLYAQAVEEVRQLKEAVASRAVIEQAKGMIMVVSSCDADTAFTELARTASTSGRKLRQVAAEIVEGLGQSLRL